jgi:NAD(P)-dependent dehydrogenase (short-subunit alcohol dehydrogenase family)
MNLDGRIALVTGSSRGIGRALAVELARRGADVIITARSLTDPTPNMPGTLSETAAEIEALGRRAHPLAADLSRPDDIDRLVQQALAWEGRVDVLVNNAVFFGRAAYQSVDELELKNWNRQFAVNVTAPFLLAKAFVPGMRAAGGGVIANLTSAASWIGTYSVQGITYGPTKAALDRLTTLLARDLEPDNIAVFALNPSYTRTVMVEQTADQTGLDPSLAHPPEVPAKLMADLVEADIATSSGKIFTTVPGHRPFLIADVHESQPRGKEIELPGSADS